MLKRESALKAREMMQAYSPSDSSDGEFLDNEEYESVNAVEAMAEFEAESFDSEDKETIEYSLALSGEKKIWCSLMTKTNLLTAPMQMHHIPYKVRMEHFGC